MKHTVLLLSIILLFGCEKSTQETTDNYILPEGLKHCKIYSLDNGGSSITVLHCPNSSTTTTHSCGKSCTANNTIIAE